MSLAKPSGSRRYIRSRGGFTLLEVLVATAVTLLMMVSLAQIFKVIGDSMKQGRAALELNSRIRNVAHRIQLDLNNMTVIPKPGVDALTGSGYLKIYDGPLTDYSYGMELALANRFGDVDDVLMFTARAGDDWFTGKVPLFVLQNAGQPPGSMPIAPTSANTQLVTITAQHAEVVIFVEPLVTNDSNPDRDPAYLALDPANNYSKLINTATGAVTDLPSSYRIHYRTLLIRPDLNVNGVLPGGLDDRSPQIRWMQAAHATATFNSTTVSLPVPICDMVNAHQQCDLSIRRIDPAAVPSALAANSLEDLANPANRFAHVQLPLSNANFTMPLLALSPKLDMTYTLAEPGVLITSTSTAAEKAAPGNNQSGFIHAAFALRADPTLVDDRTGEDVLASDVLAFDVKGYDPGATLYELNDGTNTFIVTPNDPGYGNGLTPPGGYTSTAIGTGEFVDIGWGRKAQVHFNASGIGQLSGVESTGGLPFTDSMYKSGLALQSGALVYPPAYDADLQIFQPSYDTWNQKFEGDGLFQAELAGAGRGVIRVNTGIAQGLREPWRFDGTNYVVDAGTDGVDNAGSPSGVDDLAERETSAPFPIDLRGLKVSIRIEDPSSRQFNQMSVVKEFVTQ